MRYVRYGLLIALGVILVSVSLANRDMVTVKLFPEIISGMFSDNPGIDLPLFVVILGGVAGGVIIGFVWEWIREHKHRRDVGNQGRELRQLKREVSRLKTEKHKDKDEVLAILEEAES